MPTFIRVFQNGRIDDILFPETNVFSIGGTGNNDCTLTSLQKKESIRIRKTGEFFTYRGDSIENAGKEGRVEKEKIYTINAKRAEAFAIFDADLSDIVVVDTSCQKEILIGRRDDCHLQIVSNQVSRRHARLLKTNSGWQIEDLKSANGTYLNGQVVSKALVQDGDIIDISFCQLTFNGETISVRYSGIVHVAMETSSTVKPYNQEMGYPYLFKRSPRLKKEVNEEVIEVQAAPMIGSVPEINWFSVLVTPLVSLGLMAAMVVFFRFSAASLMFSGPMALLGALGAVINYRSQKKKHGRKEHDRMEQYQSYLTNVVAQIKKVQNTQRSLLNESHPGTKVCMDMVAAMDRQLWGKRIQDRDFLTLRIGSGDVPSKVNLQVPKDFLSLEKDALANYPAKIKEEYALVHNSPITVDLLRNVTAGIIGERASALAAARNLIVQAVTHHCYDELKIVLLCSEAELAVWEFVKWLPHTFDDTRTKRFIASGENEGTKLLREFEDVVAQRYREVEGHANHPDKVSPQAPYYLFVFADYEMVREHDILKHIARNDPNAGIGALFLFDDIYCLPKECGMIIDVAAGKGIAYPRERANEEVSFSIDAVEKSMYDTFARNMAPVRVESVNKAALPTSVSFLQGYGLRRPKEYALEAAWAKAETHKGMAVPIGVRANGEPFMFDIHAKKHGPHGLVAGMTGSGKSEMVQTWILSMALKFSPEDVSFVLIDFKGTGLILPFRNLPHLAGTISDLDTSIVRNLIALENELTRRKVLLDKYDVNTIGAYKKLHKEGKADEPLSYLFVIIDEFAEFKMQYPEFMAVVNRIFATGRALGVSIILLTQKPTNVVDDKMNANTRFRWCLKVASSADSKDMLGHADAAKITNPGRAIVQIGEDEVYETIQSYYSGAPYNPYQDPALSNTDKVTVVDLQGNRASYEAEKTTGYRAAKNEIDVIVDFLDDYVRTNGVPRARNIWVQKLPETIYLKQLLSIAFDGEHWADSDAELQTAVGMIDDPRSQSQYPLKINLSTDGHLAVFGVPGTGKTTFLQTAALSFALSYSPDDLQMYVMDFGGGSMNLLKDLPHIGGIALSDDSERMDKLSRMLDEELLRRKKLFAGCGAMSIQTCAELSGTKLPYIVLLLDNFAPVFGMYPQMDEFFVRLSREGGTYGIYWIVTANTPNTLTFKVYQNIKNAVALRMPDKADYSMIVGKTDGLEPENHPGRGLVKHDPPLEFQTALPVEGASERDRIQNLRRLVSLMNEKWSGSRPRSIPVMPERIGLKNLAGPGIALGLTCDRIERLSYDPQSHPFVVVSKGVTRKDSPLAAAMVKQYSGLSFEQLIYFDGQQGACTLANGSSQSIGSPAAFDTVIAELMPVMQERKSEKAANAEAAFAPVILLLRNADTCFEAISNDTANRLNLLVTLGKNLGVMVVLWGTSSALSKLYHGGASFVVNIVNSGFGIALGDNLRTHNIFRTTLSFNEQEAALSPDEGYFIENGTATKFRAINESRE